jgi:hypothetical protein
MEANAMIRRALILLLVFAGCAWAEGPKYGGYDKNAALEFENVYHDIRTLDAGVDDPLAIGGITVSTITASSATITDARIITLTASSITATNLSVSVSTITTLQVTTLGGVTLGKVIQAVGAATTTNFSTTNTTFQTTNLSLPITPSSSSNKILVLISGPLANNTQNNTSYLSISRAGTNIGGAQGFVSMFTVTGGNTQTAAAIAYLDSPATTSSTTYAATLRVGGGTGSFGTGNETQSIVLLEIKG